MTTGAWLLVSILALAGLSLLSYAIGALDLLGAAASFFLGLLIALLGGLSWVFLMVLFTGLGVVSTRIGYAKKKRLHLAEGDAGERGVKNVMGNGAAAGLAVIAVQLSPIVPHLAVQLSFATAVAAVAADTMASELGSLAGKARSILPPFAPAQPGENGAVSLAGHLAALLGAGLIAFASIWFVGVPVHLVWVPLVAGFIGCQIDSVLGATLERNQRRPARPFGKQDVNFLASAIPAFVVLMAATLGI